MASLPVRDPAGDHLLDAAERARQSDRLSRLIRSSTT